MMCFVSIYCILSYTVSYLHVIYSLSVPLVFIGYMCYTLQSIHLAAVVLTYDLT